MNGSFVLAGHTVEVEEFVETPEEDVRAWLTRHLEPGGHLSHISDHLSKGETPVFYVILDIEYGLHPSSLWKLWDPEHTPTPRVTKQAVADGFSMRLRVAKEVFAELFPSQVTKVSLFGTPKPHSFAWPTDRTFLRHRDNLIELASIGMLDHADFLVPIVFARFPATHARYDTVAAYAMQALDTGAMIRRSNGSGLPMMPFTSIRIYGSQLPGLARVSWHEELIDTIRDSGHDIEAIAFWVARRESDECALAYFDRLFAAQDWNFDCVSDEKDDALMAAAITRQDPMADLNNDGVIDERDWDLYRAKSLSAPVTVACGSQQNCPCPVTFFDFLEFQQLFASGDPAADLNGDGVLDFFDFMIFQDLAANPCP